MKSCSPWSGVMFPSNALPTPHNMRSIRHALECGPAKDAVIDHAVTLIGYGRDVRSGEKFYLIQNSWGNNWGEVGRRLSHVTAWYSTHARTLRRAAEFASSALMQTKQTNVVGTGNLTKDPWHIRTSCLIGTVIESQTRLP